MAGVWGCLRCQVRWVGARKCWVCGDDDTLIVGGFTLETPRTLDGIVSDIDAVEYFPREGA